MTTYPNYLAKTQRFQSIESGSCESSFYGEFSEYADEGCRNSRATSIDGVNENELLVSSVLERKALFLSTTVYGPSS
jgi:hypothetical protein